MKKQPIAKRTVSRRKLKIIQLANETCRALEKLFVETGWMQERELFLQRHGTAGEKFCNQLMEAISIWRSRQVDGSVISIVSYAYPLIHWARLAQEVFSCDSAAEAYLKAAELHDAIRQEAP